MDRQSARSIERAGSMVMRFGSRSESGSIERRFDGIVCLGGEDWWYHNRGHFDFQIMRRLARGAPASWPVLFVNSLGVRIPSVRHDPQFWLRMRRKAASLARGVVEVEPGFHVFSPAMVPGRLGQKITGFALAPQIRLAARRAGIRRPLLWVHCPAGADLIGKLAEAAVVLQRTDRFEAFPEAAGGAVARQIATAKARAELVVYAAPHLMAEEADQIARSLLITHGVESRRFVEAGDAGLDAHVDEPPGMADLPRPRAAFIGGIDAHTFDPELFLAVARRLPDVHFPMIGGCSLPEGWCDLPNVTLLGRQPYDQVARYMAAADVLLMPWNKSSWIEACNPVKLKEYLAIGRPVVTTDFPALGPWRNLVRVADTPETFAAAISAALTEPHDPRPARARLAGEDWDDKAALVQRTLLELGLVFTPTPGRRASPAPVRPAPATS
jgi:glycosyltransferase involved in cell wall biosynthesis